jgi:uncharacterized paraquat-inducible protein A
MSFFAKGFWEDLEEDTEEIDVIQCDSCGCLFDLPSELMPQQCPRCSVQLDHCSNEPIRT